MIALRTRTKRCGRRRGMIRFWHLKLVGAPLLLSWVVRRSSVAADAPMQKPLRRCIDSNGGENRMSENMAILTVANAAVAVGDYERFLSVCADDTEWTFVGDRILKGKEAVRRYMATTYIEPPKFTVTDSIAGGDFLTVLGDITLKDEDGKATRYSYCDVWRFRDGKIVELRAFVIKPEEEVAGG